MSTSDGARGCVDLVHAIHSLVSNCLRLDLVALEINSVLERVAIVLDRVSRGKRLCQVLVHCIDKCLEISDKLGRNGIGSTNLVCHKVCALFLVDVHQHYVARHLV